MKNLIALAVVLLLITPAFAVELKTDADKRSYALGANVGKNIKMGGVTVDPKLVAQGVIDELDGKSQLSDAELGAIMMQVQNEVRQKLTAEREAVAKTNKKKGEDFLAANAKAAGVKTLPGGVQYKVIKTGKGKKPVDTDTVECSYTGTLIDGKIFDATPAGKTATFKLGQVIPGWREALKQMAVGSKWQLFVPSDQAYGERGAGNTIGPNETLLFEVELLGIK